MSNPTDSVSISILDRNYQFTCLPDEREALRAAALHLDGKMREVKSAGNLMALERVAVMAALNLSDELLKLRSRDQRRADSYSSCYEATDLKRRYIRYTKPPTIELA